MPFVTRPPGPACSVRHYRPEFDYGTYQADRVGLRLRGLIYGYLRLNLGLDTQGGYLERRGGDGTFYSTAAIELGDYIKEGEDWWQVMERVGPSYRLRWYDNRDAFIVTGDRVWGPAFGPVFG